MSFIISKKNTTCYKPADFSQAQDGQPSDIFAPSLTVYLHVLTHISVIGQDCVLIAASRGLWSTKWKLMNLQKNTSSSKLVQIRSSFVTCHRDMYMEWHEGCH